MSATIPELIAFACSVMSYDCSTVPVPTVVREPIFQAGYFGLFQPERGAVIVLDSQMVPYLDETYRDSIIAHELTHYIDYVLSGGTSLSDLCKAEANSWRVENAWLTVHGKGELADFDWQVRYNCL